MLFNSLQFALFLPLVVAFHFLLPHRFRWALLLVASYYFYMSWEPAYAFLIMGTTLVAYWTGLRMGQTHDPDRRKLHLVISLFANLGVLFVFKYFGFFFGSLQGAFSALRLGVHLPVLDVLLPVGISFYSFQALSYSIDVYRGKQDPEKHLGIFALYVSFFPQLVAGPIERSTRLLPQFRVPSNVDYDRVVAGLRQMLWGFFKKLVIADRLAMLVNAVYADPTQHNGVGIMLATVFFAYQIYCDFSGYSDIAIGAARILGYELMTNFDRPYHAASLSNFWHRWHISLSTWFRDYVYIPMGGRRVRVRRWHLNIMIVFTVSGLWHGANWTFVVWGALHGLYLIAGTLGSGLRQRVGAWLRMDRWPRVASHASVVTTFGLVCIAWIFFRANNMGDALYCLTHLAEGVPEFLANLGDTAYLSATLSRLGMSRVDLVVSCCSILFLELVESLGASSFDWLKLGNLPRPLRWAGYYALVSAILLLGSFSSAQDFIYFQF